MKKVKLHNKEEINKVREAGHAAACVLDMIQSHIVIGITTKKLDKICHNFIVNKLKVIPANLGYNGFAHTICTSINEVVCHGIPSDRKLRDGDIINIDVAVIKDGWYGDTSRMYFVGTPSIKAKCLVNTCYEAMIAGINVVKPEVTINNIGIAIQRIAKQKGFSVVREYCGHGIGQTYHTYPQIIHYNSLENTSKLKTGMIFTIEPMLNEGKAKTVVLSDGWTVETRDHSLSAQWEHTIAVTDNGFEVLTK
ncbi:type I methionyl aminopeptidase [Candidatus Ishikawella capsulata]|uniref:Methionine aminopeptidase n=1 Tax=Candidatus Ishikawaella capsulata Mpkobe TaxID=476281 RepID=C5WDT5_9ENTR|nr:type I methionyl aminopeptidase [Candidatus Ishikawaella capsulata]BAH83491.1 methionine aminopeptidase [Candidatus Ishikawaella capsulata Mpkobe]